MKLIRVRLKNFRCYTDETSIELGDLTMVAGRNDAGKSTLFEGLSAFFGESKLDLDDACLVGDPKDVRIICEFEEYPSQLVLDAGYKTSLEEEYLLNSRGLLEIHQIWNCSLKTPKSAMFAMANHPSVENYNDLLILKNSDLKKRANALKVSLDGIDSKVNAQLRKRIWESVEQLDLSENLIPLDKETGKQVWGQLKIVLPTFALFKADRSSIDTDPEAQDPMKSAMKEAFKSMDDTLNAVVDQVKSQVQMTANRTLEKLKEMHPDLANELSPRFTEPNWANVMKVSLTGDEDIPINKRGSGVRRLVLLNFFRAKAETAAFERGDSLPVIYAIEEPETSQHPNNQKMLMKALMELAASEGSQVFLTTHNPMLARMVPTGCIRYICEENGCKIVREGNASTMKMISKDLGVLPDHGVKLFVGVEGINDINFLQNLSQVLIQHGENVPDLKKLEEEGQIVFIPCGGTNLALWSSRLANLNIPEFHIFDGDKPEYATSIAIVNEREGCSGLQTTKLEMENYLHEDAIKSVQPDLLIPSITDFNDVPMITAQAVHACSDSEKGWDELNDKKKKKKMSRAKLWLNNEAVLKMTPSLLSERDPDSEVMGWFSSIATYLEA